jgi:dTDP-4-dehydrorhamnose reductase
VLLDRAVVIGAGGQLGSEIMRELARHAPIGLDHEQIEIEDDGSVEKMFADLAPTLVINTAAFLNVDECERRPDRAFAVNSVAVERLAAAALRHGAVLATISTDYVFDGNLRRPYSEADVPNPRTIYGVSKLAGEMCVRRRAGRYFIFRTSGLYGVRVATQKGYTFVDQIIDRVRAGERPTVVTDMFFSPSYAADVAAAIRAVFERETYGLYHVTNAGACSWFQFAEHALHLAGLPANVEPIVYKDFNSIVPRPAYSVLACNALNDLGVEMPPWRDALRRYIAARAVSAA